MLDFILPKVCPFCESVLKKRKICDACLADIRFIREERAICSKCGVPFGFPPEVTYKDDPASVGAGPRACPNEGLRSKYCKGVAPTASLGSNPGHLCGRCLLDDFYFQKARSVAFYDGLLRDILHKFKYEEKLGLGGVLSSILIENFPNDLDAPELVIPVPLYIDRLRHREYNQSVILGVNLARYLRVSFDPFVLKRVRDTKPQFEIKSEDERRKNVKGAFSVENFEKIKEKSVLLIDDVFTTGSTINECTRALLRAGASWVQAVTLMRAV